MPILHTQYKVQAADASDGPVNLPPRVGLSKKGPVVQVAIKVPPVIEEELASQDATVPDPVTGLMLIDTGASNTCIDERVAKQLALPAVGSAKIASVSESDCLRDIYPVAIELIGMPAQIVVNAIGVELGTHGLVGLLGRDALAGCTLFYNGLAGEITFAR